MQISKSEMICLVQDLDWCQNEQFLCVLNHNRKCGVESKMFVKDTILVNTQKEVYAEESNRGRRYDFRTRFRLNDFRKRLEHLYFSTRHSVKISLYKSTRIYLKIFWSHFCEFTFWQKGKYLKLMENKNASTKL